MPAETLCPSSRRGDGAESSMGLHVQPAQEAFLCTPNSRTHFFAVPPRFPYACAVMFGALLDLHRASSTPELLITDQMRVF